MFTFKKTERLCSKKEIDLLYTTGKQRTIHPLKIYWRITTLNDAVPLRALFSVPKRRFKKAVHRNRIKRQLRETFRLNRQDLSGYLSEKQLQCDLMVLYIGHELPVIADLEKALLPAFTHIRKELEKD